MSGPPPAQAVLWGDSHADHLFPGLAAKDPNPSWLLLGHMSCPPTVGIDVVADQPDCRVRAESALRWIERQTSIDTVVIAFFGYYGEDTDVAQVHRDGPVGPSKTRIDGWYDRTNKSKALAKGLHDAVKRLVAAHKTVVIVIDVPELPFSPVDCFMPPRVLLGSTQCTISMDEVARRQASMREIVSRIAAEYPEIQIVDPLPAICGPRDCGPGTPFAPIYRDSHHLSISGSAKVAELILKAAGLVGM